MARKAGPQPLTLEGASYRNEQQQFIDSPISTNSLKSPKSPRSPFNFTTKKTQVEQSMQASEPRETQQNRADLPQSQTVPALNQYCPAPGKEETQERERPAKGGFFSSYKASKSSNRLQDKSRGTEAGMSRDSDRSAMSGKVSSQDSNRNGTTFSRFVFCTSDDGC